MNVGLETIYRNLRTSCVYGIERDIRIVKGVPRFVAEQAAERRKAGLAPGLNAVTTEKTGTGLIVAGSRGIGNDPNGLREIQG